MTRSTRRRFRTRDRQARIAAALVTSLAIELALLPAARARADGFLDEIAAGRAAATASGVAAAGDASARGIALELTLARQASERAAFTIGAILAALDADLTSPPASRPRGSRTIVARHVRRLLAAQMEAGIGNRALCLLSGRSDPKSLERQVRLVEPRWSCEHG